MRTTVLCEACRRGPDDGTPGLALDGLRLCAPCARLLARRIQDLPQMYEECGRALGGAAPGGVREHTSGGPLPGMTINGTAMEVRTEVLGTLSAWSGLVAEQRGVTAPQRQVARLAGFLLRHLRWLAAHPAAGDAAAEFAQLARAARRALAADPVRRVQVGGCVETGCRGRLVATFRSGGLDERTRIRCDADPDHSWAAAEWTLLRRAVPGAPAGESWLTAQDIARLWNTPVGTVYRLASEHHWPRRSHGGRTYYSEQAPHAHFTHHPRPTPT
ncbi:helix-turn-helix domain-containing protein [Actinacidiphila bryophytorum]|uniref:helix-turn-helix domain-containing protein n=1 Tax=Actinacidiphila bryophytorum TaxID=1436133 RepID=UPI002176A6D4|nr:helix-turn-helix domain-containing protein [Actinacidiphila bryophytorum]UWE09993.1 helix-turn-helix domain-containing protein [Actinacidiphila bryophytorum]